MEVVTLVQTLKIKKALPIVLFGKEFWEKVINFQTLIDFGTISPDDIDLFFITDSIDDAFKYVSSKLVEDGLPEPGAHL